MTYPSKHSHVNLKTQENKHLSICSAHVRIIQGTSSSSPHSLHIPSLLSSSYCFLPPL